MQTIASKQSQDLVSSSVRLDDDELDSKIACNNYELAPLLLCQSSNDFYQSVPSNNKSAITTITSTNCSRSKTKGSGFKLNKNLFQNLNSMDYFNNSLWKNVVNKKNFSSESMMRSLADDTLKEQQKIRFDRKQKTSLNRNTSNQDENSVDLYVTNANSLADKTRFKSSIKSFGKFRIKPNMSLKSEISKIQKQSKLNQFNNANAINEAISITSTNTNNLTANNGTLTNPDTIYTKLLAGKSSLNLKSEINVQRKPFNREKTNINLFKEPAIETSSENNNNYNKDKPFKSNFPSKATKLPFLFNKTDSQIIMPQKYLESLEVKKISPVNKYNIYDFAEIFDSTSQLFVDFDNNRLFLPELNATDNNKNEKKSRHSESFDLNLKFEQFCLNDYSNDYSTDNENKMKSNSNSSLLQGNLKLTNRNFIIKNKFFLTKVKHYLMIQFIII